MHAWNLHDPLQESNDATWTMGFSPGLDYCEQMDQISASNVSN